MITLPNKIKNLKFLEKDFKIPVFIFFQYEKYSLNKEKYLNLIKKKFKKKKIIIRSASRHEDSQFSNAGKFLSVKNIEPFKFNQVDQAINDVFKSYGKKSLKQFILVQNYVQDADLVGVIFSKDVKNGFDFRTVNFSQSKSTDLITSGKSNGKIIYYYKNYEKNIKDKNIRKIEIEIKKLEKRYKNKPLDIEFLIKKNKFYLLQVRNLKISHTKKNTNVDRTLINLKKKLSKILLDKYPDYIKGRKRIFSTMTDWNPVEILGLKPNYLSISLYKSLITDSIWSKSRNNLGYKDVQGIPLLHTFLGTPYIDVTLDINSFLSKNLPDQIQKKLVNFYLREFKKKPHYYFDKIESSLVINCVTIDNENFYKILSKLNLDNKEKKIIFINYRDLTENIILKLKKNINSYKKGYQLFNELKNLKKSPINKIFHLHTICKNYGTLPFANIARMAFISIEFLNSFVKCQIISKDDKQNILESLNTISLEMNNLLIKKNKKKFFEKFGHLRPNSYDISNLNYKSNFSNYFQHKDINKIKSKKFNFTRLQKNKINFLLKKNKFKKINAEQLIYFIFNSIAEREASKLFFTKIIDEIFLELKKFSKRISLPEEKLKHIDILKILSLYGKYSNDYLIHEIKHDCYINQKEYDYNLNFNLPSTISDTGDIYYFKEEKAHPSFITNLKISSEIILLKNFNKKINLKNKLVCVENADPGYDFIFNQGISGLITAYGGPNSHMSIRCNEFQIPAVIGVGEKKFQQLIRHQTLHINCQKKIVSPI